MKKLFKRLAKYVVAAYANRLYRKAVKLADSRHAQERTMIYVVSGLAGDTSLACCNRAEFRAVKEKLHIKDSVSSLKAGSWYHTADAIGRNSLAPIDKEARKRAFVRMVIERAGL